MPQRIPINYIKLYKRGEYGTYNGFSYPIDHVTIRGDKLFVHFDGIRDPIDADLVGVEVTAIDFNRDNGGPRAYVLESEKPSEPAPVQDFDDDDLLKDFLA